jgi:hypothetical protein
MMSYDGAIPVSYREVKEDPLSLVNKSDSTSSGLPATLESVRFLRHPKAQFDAPYLEPLKNEINLDIELGLKGQFDLDQKKILKKDIDELTRSNNYWEVTHRTLDKLFKVPQLRMSCVLPNLKEALTQSILGARVPLILSGLFFFFAVAAILFGCAKLPRSLSFFTGPACGLLGICAVVAIIMANSSFFSNGFMNRDVSFKYWFIGVKLNMESVSQTAIQIPYPAKLKMKEAKDSGLFEGFSIVRPEFFTDQKSFKPSFQLPLSFDPAILGVTKDNRMFMVVWWDIEHDVVRVKTNIKKFKKFKIA